MDYIKRYKFGTDISPIFLNKILPLTNGKKIIDLGCGQGEHLKYFGPESIGFDISPKNIKVAIKNGLKVKLSNMNQPPLLEEKYDVVFSSHLIEHLENPVTFLRYSRKQIKKNGFLVISLPNEHSVIHLKYPYFTYDGNHLYSISLRNLRELLEYVGYEEVIIYYDYYTALSKKLGINRFLGIIDCFPKPVREYLAWSFWLIAKKK